MRITFKLLYSFVIILTIFSCKQALVLPYEALVIPQSTLTRVDSMPDLPKPYKYRDWNKTAKDFDRLAFDFDAKGDFFPLIWWDTMGRNFADTTFGLYTAFGDIRMGAKVNNGENHEALGALGAVLGATLVGIDKSNQDGHNYVKMLRNYFNKDNGWNVIQNFTNKGAHIGGGYGNDFWYEVHNNVLFYCVADKYSNIPDFEDIQLQIAEQFYKSDSIMGDNYSYSYFDFKEMKGVVNQIPTQEDVAGGYAFILYSAYKKFDNPKYLKAAKNALNVLYNQKENRFYEAMMPIAAHIAARMNAEEGTEYDVKRFLNWTFDGDAVGRVGWGVLKDTWGGYDVSGLAGSTVHNGGYGFLMNTFDLILPLTALVKYDPSYAATVGKWVLNASNAARFCYPMEIPDSLQAIPSAKTTTKDIIAYEGLIKNSNYDAFKGRTPFAQGDGPLWYPDMPRETMFSVYGSGHVGFFGGLIQPTDQSMILQIDCSKADFYPSQTNYSTYLYYNPFNEGKNINLTLDSKRYNVYDAVSKRVILTSVTGKNTFHIRGKQAVVLLLVPTEKVFTVKNNQLLAGDVVVDYHYNKAN